MKRARFYYHAFFTTFVKMKINLYKIISVLLISFFADSLFSQVNEFQITYGDNQSNWGKAIPVSDGGYIIMANDSTWPASSDIIMIKTDSIGNIAWTKKYGNTSNTDDISRGVIEAYNGGYLIAGTLNVTTGPAVSVWIRTDSNGDTLWVKRDVIGQGTLIKTSDYGYALVGSGLTKTDSMGNIQWAKIYTAVMGSPAYGQQTADRGYIISGLTAQYASGGPLDRDLVLIKTDSVGNIQWTKVYGRPTTFEYSPKVVQTDDGGYLVLSTTGIVNQSTTYDLMLIKTDAAGNLQWTKIYGGASYDEGVDLKATGAIGYIITGRTVGFEPPFQNSMRSFMLRTDGNGTPVWTKMYGDMANNNYNSMDEAHYINYTADGGFLLSGCTQSFGVGDWDVWLIKTDALGVSGCNEIVTNPTVTIPTLTIGTGGYDSAVFYTSSPYTIAVGTWQPTKTILCLNGSLTGETDNSEIGNDITIYPNPSNGIFQLTIDNVQFPKAEIEVYNMLGELVYFSELRTPNSRLDLSSLPSGIYFVRITTKDGIVSRKIVKE